MHNKHPFLTIKRITEFEDDELVTFNSLLDEGTSWDGIQGAKFLSNDDNALFVAYWQNKIVGFLTAYRLQRFDKQKAEVLLYEIGVADTHQRKGIATALITELKNWARDSGAIDVWVLTNKSNTAAFALYSATGGECEADDEQMFVFKL